MNLIGGLWINISLLSGRSEIAVPHRYHRFEWDDLRFFLGVCRHKTVSAAGQQLGVDHATVSRRVARLEHALNTKLFEHRPTGFVPTPSRDPSPAHGRGRRSLDQRVRDRAFRCRFRARRRGSDWRTGLFRCLLPCAATRRFLQGASQAPYRSAFRYELLKCISARSRHSHWLIPTDRGTDHFEKADRLSRRLVCFAGLRGKPVSDPLDDGCPVRRLCQRFRRNVCRSSRFRVGLACQVPLCKRVAPASSR